MQPLDVSVGLWSPGAEAGVTNLEIAERVGKDATAELLAVVGEHALEPPAGRLELGRDAAREAAGVLGDRPPTEYEALRAPRSETITSTIMSKEAN